MIKNMLLLLFLITIVSKVYAGAYDIITSEGVNLFTGHEYIYEDEGQFWTRKCFVQIQSFSPEEEIESLSVEFLNDNGVSLLFNPVENGLDLIELSPLKDKSGLLFRTEYQRGSLFNSKYEVTIRKRKDSSILDFQVITITGGLSRSKFFCSVHVE